MPRENGFENKRVVIIGGSSGIGLAVAKEAASQGANVVIVSSNAGRVQEAIRLTCRMKRLRKAFLRT